MIYIGCYHPQLLHYEGINSDTGKPIYKFVGVQGVHEHYEEKRDPRDILIPCRKCIGCRLDYSKRWADRLMLELDHSKTALFLTLTYDNEHVTPAMYDDELDCWWFTLVKKDLQDFNKRLRYYFPGKNIRFFAAGEYGDKTLRPHYHGIYFGLSLADFPDLKPLFLNEFHQQIYTSDKLASIWQNGHVSIGNVSWQSCAYVARYNLKKLSHGVDDIASSRNCIPEFALMSRKPGIGGYFFLDHPEFLETPRDKIILADNFGVKPVGSINLPSYLFSKLEFTNPELYAIIKEEKKLVSESSFFKELAATDKNEFDYLLTKEKMHEKASDLLKRPLDS